MDGFIYIRKFNYSVFYLKFCVIYSCFFISKLRV